MYQESNGKFWSRTNDADMSLHTEFSLVYDRDWYSVRAYQCIKNITFLGLPNRVEAIVVSIGHKPRIRVVNSTPSNIAYDEKRNSTLRFWVWKVVAVGYG